jgi:hypothetical protein
MDLLLPDVDSFFFDSFSFDLIEGTNLEIKNVSKSDEGRYVCRAENALGNRDSRPATLTIQGELQFRQNMKRDTISYQNKSKSSYITYSVLSVMTLANK